MATIPILEMTLHYGSGYENSPFSVGVLAALGCMFYSKEKGLWLITSALSAFTKRKDWHSEESVAARERQVPGS
jgi:hypothetical protein